MKVALYHLDGKLPNIALMRISAHHKAEGDSVELFRGKPTRGKQVALLPTGYEAPDIVYGSTIFQSSRPVVDQLKALYPKAIIGGTGLVGRGNSALVEIGVEPGVDILKFGLEDIGIHTLEQDYSIYPEFKQSIGFSQRGCRLKCEFCVVPRKEGRARPEQSIASLWRGDPWPREIVLLDNDFFGNPEWRERIAEIRDGNFKVSFTQGINARCLTEEAAEAIASVSYRNDSMDTKRIYTAWDNKGDEAQLFNGLRRLVKYGVKPDHIMVFILVGYWPGETAADRDYRRKKLRDFGARPYPMPYVRNRELVGFQRWIMGAYDKPSKKNPEGVSWERWETAGYRPENLGKVGPLCSD
jgi:hypothetical protein